MDELQRIYELFLSAGIHNGRYRALAKFPTPTPAPTSTAVPINLADCQPASEVGLDDLGKTMCIYGIVTFTYQGEGYTSLSFTKDKGAFYLLSYDVNLRVYAAGTCVRAVSEVKELSGSPVMVIGFRDILESCP